MSVTEAFSLLPCSSTPHRVTVGATQRDAFLTMSAIPFNDLSRLTKAFQLAFMEACQRVLSRGYYILGPESKGFEEEFALCCGVNYCVSLANGTDAIELALRAVGVTPADTVATVANAGGYSTTAIRAIGAIPVYIDIDEASMLMSAESLIRAIQQHQLKAIVVTHLYGMLADMPALLKLAKDNGIALVEDCAQSHGASREGKRAGSWGDIAAFSFYPTKNLGALGDGGAVVTNQGSLAEAVRELRQYGWKTKYRSERTGGRNSRLDELQAAFLRIQLPSLDSRTLRRQTILQRYQQGLASTPLKLPVVDASHVGHLYVVRHSQRDQLRSALQQQDIGTDIHYPIPDHLQPATATWQTSMPSLPVTERNASQLFSLPCFPELTDSEVDAVIAAVQTACRSFTAH